MKPGNRKGTNPGPPDRTRRTAIVLRMPPPVLNGTGANCGPPFGTKRPQVQILSPRPFPQVSDAGMLFLARGVPPPSPRDRGLEGTKKNTREQEGKPGPTSTGRRTPGLPARSSRPRGTAGSVSYTHLT